MHRAGAPAKRAAARWKVEAVLEELKQLAGRIGLRVREEKLLREVGYQVRSGACRFRDEDLLLIDRELPPAVRLEILLEQLSKRDLGAVYVSPELRRLLGKEETTGS